MPELHKLTPELGVLQSRGQRVALVTDGRMSGASGKVPAAIHLHPEWADGGDIGRIRDGDPVVLDAEAGQLDVDVPAAEWAARSVTPMTGGAQSGIGREMFAGFRAMASDAETGAVTFTPDGGA
jgi:phosphogluconate dehydratase